MLESGDGELAAVAGLAETVAGLEGERRAAGLRLLSELTRTLGG